MSQNHLNYINGVPVKISEKYKPPIKIQMNQNLSHRLANVDNEISQLLASNYDFSLEKNVLNKLSEWERVRQQQNCDRKERIRGRQQEQQRHIEQKQKQMLTSVSYPSTDDLSSDDDRESSNDSTTIKQSSTDSETTTNAVILKSGHFSPANCFDNILIPTVIPEQLLNNRTSNILAPKFNKINYSDFENDTSSPFDNVELKTMNDLDILAQVLNINTKISDENKSVKGNQTNQSADINQKQTNVTVNTPSRMNASDYQSIYHTQQQNCSVQSPLANSYYDQSRFVNSNQPQMNQNAYNYVSQSYSNDQHTSPGKGLSYQLTEYSNIINSLKSSKNEYYNGFNGRKETCNPQQLYQNNFVNNRNYYSQGPNKLAFHTQQPEIPNISKSKSVPDIVQELNNDLKNSERKRTRNNSQSSVNTANDEDHRTLDPNLVNNKSMLDDQSGNSVKFLQNLSASSQKLAKSISLMGFPLERVSRITEKFGKDDKKIIEHLIPLSELLDLGFDENKISEALIKFDNDKEKALDYLIS